VKDSHHISLDNNIITKNSGSGIRLVNSSHCNVSTNDIENFGYYGIRLFKSWNNTIIQNRVYHDEDSGPFGYAVYLFNATDNLFLHNRFTDLGLGLHGEEVRHVNTNDIDQTNTINGKPIVYLMNERNITVPKDAAQIILANCTDMVVDHFELSNSSYGIMLAFSDNITVENNTVKHNLGGMKVLNSFNCTIENNDIYMNSFGIYSESQDRS
jgi:parallel beta-helix repeat protein